MTVPGRAVGRAGGGRGLGALEETVAVLSDSQAVRALARADAELTRGGTRLRPPSTTGTPARRGTYRVLHRSDEPARVVTVVGVVSRADVRPPR